MIDNESWYPWTDIKNGRYSYCEKKYGCKLTKKLLEQAVKDGVVKSLELTVKGFTFTVYNEADIIVGLARHKFKKVVVKPEGWF